ncbi:MAG: adenosine deaminase [Acidobacteria bacterium]|jgi:aminodeoxyfutalosine deaminase|nr:MAG: adenosine deaminase [Acidobacteriota bacterium]
MSSAPSAFLRTLPKAELHLHLEGSIEPSTLLELKRRHGQHAIPEEVDRLYQFQDFTGFLMAFKGITENLQSPDDYELITYRLMERLKTENVLHAEVFVSVGVCLWRVQDFPLIFEALDRARLRGEKDFGVSLLWIFDAVRQFGPEAAMRVFEIAARYKDRGVVGIGIGGDEMKAPPELFRQAYAWASDHGLRLTAHAGENAGPDSIWGALNLRAERIGHGLSAARDPELLEELAVRQIPIDVCLTSNLRTACCRSLADHPIRSYFDRGLMITLNTDDPGMFRTTLSREYRLAQNSFGFNDEHLRELARNSFEASFLPAEQKLFFLNLFDAVAARP